MFVGIDLGIEEDEQQIFDTINSLGVRLTTAELLKNYFFHRDKPSEYETYWKDVFEADDETKEYWDREITTGRLKRTFIDLFFYSYIQIKIQQANLKVKTEDKLRFAKVESLFESYKLLIKEYGLDKGKILNEIKEYAILFKANFNYDIINNELSSEFGIDRINAIIFGLDTSTLIPFVLYVLKNIENEVERNEIFQFTESYIIRRMIVRASTKNYNQLFTDSLISNNIESREDLQNYLETKSDKTNYIPTNEDLRKGFNNSIITNKQAAGILYLIESKIRDRNKQSTQLLGINKYSLEHLMPKKWENNWGSLNTKEEIDNRNFKLKTIGNLAIITQSLNASIRDANWDIKINGRANKQGLKHFSGGIETLSPYLEIVNWNEVEIKKRADFLYETSIELWKTKDI